jgi:serine/threonine-protein kinase
LERIAAGGMGEVWRAEHRMLARPAAIKLIRPEMVGGGPKSELAQRRFEREAHATAMLRSPHTVALYDYGVTDDGQFYYAMELLDGIDLDALVTRFGPQPAGRAVHILRQACNSLAEAHERGLVHRDIKPRNLMLCRLGIEADFLKVLDFGLAKNPEGDTELTAEGMTAGTPAFLAPEAAMGKREVDGRADLYGLGCVGYWLLTGKLVFERDTPMGMIVAHAHEKPPALSERTEVPIPERLEAVVLACLEKDREERPASARELDGLLAACGVEWTSSEADHWWRTHKPGGAGSQTTADS